MAARKEVKTRKSCRGRSSTKESVKIAAAKLKRAEERHHKAELALKIAKANYDFYKSTCR